MNQPLDFDSIAHAYARRYVDYEYPGVDALDRQRFPAVQQVREWMTAACFGACRTLEVQHLVGRQPARAALERGLLDKTATSQLGLLSDQQYAVGIARIEHALKQAEARGEALDLLSDLHLYATFGIVEAA